ncbi:MAG TPA: glycoside hydrolase domain-containing protein [Terriglobales bacterium]|nr:glycoside hydrolase domain-containing protein [Terriglobales bacterium]
MGKRLPFLLSRLTFHLALLVGLATAAALQSSHAPATYLGFDRNQYPGDDSLAALRKTFRFTSYWLNNPPGESSNTWKGKRALLKSRGFGFLVLFNGRTYEQLRAPADAVALAMSDGKSAVAAAKNEGFPAGTVIFLDQEQGGRLLPEQRAYLYAWVDAVNQAGYRAGGYCSGMPFTEASGETVITAEDIHRNAGNRIIVYWVANDACPLPPGCALRAAPVGRSGLSFAEVWQFAQSPLRAQFASGCADYAADGNCYAPGTQVFVDLDAADSPDPSRGR